MHGSKWIETRENCWTCEVKPHPCLLPTPRSQAPVCAWGRHKMRGKFPVPNALGRHFPKYGAALFWRLPLPAIVWEWKGRNLVSKGPALTRTLTTTPLGLISNTSLSSDCKLSLTYHSQVWSVFVFLEPASGTNDTLSRRMGVGHRDNLK